MAAVCKQGVNLQPHRRSKESGFELMQTLVRLSRTAALVALITLLAGCAATLGRPQPSAPSSTDEALAHRVYLSLNADPWYFFRHVDVQVADGVADLSGQVWSADAIYRARQIAATVPGVTRVVTSNLELERNGLGNSPVSR
jgi:BON domain